MTEGVNEEAMSLRSNMCRSGESFGDGKSHLGRFLVIHKLLRSK